MAVDSKAKRFSMMALGRGAILIDPDGTIAQADRQHLLWLYGGIAAISPAARGINVFADTRSHLVIETGDRQHLIVFADSRQHLATTAGIREG